MLRRLSLGLLASAITLASLHAIAREDSSADDLVKESISLNDVVKPQTHHWFSRGIAGRRNSLRPAKMR